MHQLLMTQNNRERELSRMPHGLKERCGKAATHGVAVGSPIEG